MAVNSAGRDARLNKMSQNCLFNTRNAPASSQTCALSNCGSSTNISFRKTSFQPHSIAARRAETLAICLRQTCRAARHAVELSASDVGLSPVPATTARDALTASLSLERQLHTKMTAQAGDHVTAGHASRRLSLGADRSASPGPLAEMRPLTAAMIARAVGRQPEVRRSASLLTCHPSCSRWLLISSGHIAFVRVCGLSCAGQHTSRLDASESGVPGRSWSLQ